MLTNTRLIKDTLYALKQDFGIAATVYRLEQDSVNYATGAKTPTSTPYRVKRLVLLPLETRILQDFNLVQSNFKYGGGFEIGDRECLIDKRDLPILVNEDDYIVFDSRRYNILQIVDVQHCYYLHIRTSKEQSPYQKIDGIFHERPFIVETFGGEK